MQQAAHESMEVFKRSGESSLYDQAGMEENLARQLRDQARLAKGGEIRAAHQEAFVQFRHATWLHRARALVASGRSAREVAGIIASDGSVGAKAVREALKKAGFY